MSVVYFTDSCADLPQAYCKQHNLRVVPLMYKINDREYYDDFGQSLSYHSFYDMLRGGMPSSTSQISTFTFLEVFRPILEKGDDIFYIAFSSVLSGTYQGALLAKEQLQTEFPERSVYVWDSKCASMGEGLLVHYVLRLRDEGKSPEEVYAWLEENTLNFAHWFTVADLNHLRRGGRVTATAAFLGTMLSIKPVLHVDNTGALIPVEKVKGRTRSLRALVDQVGLTAIEPEGQTMFISHGDNQADAELVMAMIKERYGTKDFLIHPVGPVVGAHSGPDTIALFFLAKHR